MNKKRLRSLLELTKYAGIDCGRCDGKGWICEEHTERGWPHDDCPGPGMPCPACLPHLQPDAEVP